MNKTCLTSVFMVQYYATGPTSYQIPEAQTVLVMFINIIHSYMHVI
jgi:hypothetical protein